MKYRVSFGFCELPDSGVVPFATGVHDGLAANAATFASLPVTVVALKTATDNYDSALGAANKAGVAQHFAKDSAHDVLIGLLRQLAFYVDGVAQGDAVKIRLAGFEAISHAKNPPVPLDRPVIVKVFNDVSTQLRVRVQPLAHAHSFIVEYAVGDGPWQSGDGGTNSRGLILQGLTRGTVYRIRVKALGGSTGASDWSLPVECVCT